MSSMSLASTFKSASFKHFTNVSHVNGSRPFPHIHFFKITQLIFSASRIHSCSMAETIVPLLSLSKSIPKVLYFSPICSAMLMLPCLLGNFSRLGRLGLLPVAEFIHVHNEDYLNYNHSYYTKLHMLHNHLVTDFKNYTLSSNE